MISPEGDILHRKSVPSPRSVFTTVSADGTEFVGVLSEVTGHVSYFTTDELHLTLIHNLLKGACGVAPSNEEHVYLTDTESDQVHVFRQRERTWKHLRQFSTPAGPYDVTEQDGSVFVSCTSAAVIVVQRQPESSFIPFIDEGLLRPRGLAWVA